MYNSNNIAEAIKKIAKEKKVSIKQLLNDVGLGYNTMSNMKTSMPKADNLAKIADYLDCSVDFLLGRSKNADVHQEKKENGDLSEEQRLLTAFRKLTDEGKKTVLSIAEMSAQNPQYQKYTDVPKEV